jgi:hypothetical protein
MTPVTIFIFWVRKSDWNLTLYSTKIVLHREAHRRHIRIRGVYEPLRLGFLRPRNREDFCGNSYSVRLVL